MQVASNTHIRYAISLATEMERVWLVRLTCLSDNQRSHKLGRYQPRKRSLKWSRRHQSNEAIKESVIVCKSSEKTKQEHPSIGCCANSSKTSTCELIHEVQAPQAVADFYQQKDHLSYRKTGDWMKQLDHNKYWKVNLRHCLRRYICASLRENCHVKKLSCRWKLACKIAWETMIFIIRPNTANYSTVIICPVERSLRCSHIASLVGFPSI